MRKTTRRRPPGAGALYQNARGLWIGAFNAGHTPDGKRQRITVSSKNRSEARRKLETAMAAYKTGQLQPGRSPTLREFATEWLEQREKQVTPNTRSIEKAALEQNAIPLLGHKRLNTLRPSDLRTLGEHVIEAGGSPSTAARYQSVFLRMLREAEQEGLTVQRAILAAKKTQIRVKDERTAIPVSDTLKLIHAAQAQPQGVRWLLALMQGIRQGEALGLTWDAIDLEACSITIDWQLQSLPYKDEDDPDAGFTVPLQYEAHQLLRAYHLVRPKTHTSRRVIPLTPWVQTALAAYREAWEENPWGLLFTTRGKPVSRHADARAWKALQTKADVCKTEDGDDKTYYVLHEARHTTATLLLAAGVEPEIIKAIMGHSDIVTQATYQHVNQDMARNALQRVEGLLEITP